MNTAEGEVDNCDGVGVELVVPLESLVMLCFAEQEDRQSAAVRDSELSGRVRYGHRQRSACSQHLTIAHRTHTTITHTLKQGCVSFGHVSYFVQHPSLRLIVHSPHTTANPTRFPYCYSKTHYPSDCKVFSTFPSNTTVQK